MGSAGSVPQQPHVGGNVKDARLQQHQQQNEHQSSQPQSKRHRQYPKDLRGPALIEHVCRPKKTAWEDCVGGWYNGRFLTGAALEEESSEEGCDVLFERYKKCYVRGMARERKRQGYAAPKKGSLLDDYLQEQEEAGDER